MAIELISPEYQEKYFKQKNYIYYTIDIETELIINREDTIKKFVDFELITKILPPDSIIAGGYVLAALRGKPDHCSDIDIYFKNENSYFECIHVLEKEGYKFKLPENISKPVFADTFEKEGHKPVQLIRTMWFKSAEHVIDTFDFTVCQYAIENGFLIFNPLSIIDTTQNKLVIHRLNFPRSIKRRIDKYIGKKYKISPIMVKKVDDAIKNSEDGPDSITDFITSLY